MLRELQRVFNPSKFFAPWLAAQRAERARQSTHQRQRRRDQHLQVKVGHGGTLDPMATGVLVVGVGKGTKQLQSFLESTKSYEATILFGAATDTYDVFGKMLCKAPYEHITEVNVAKALGAFKGNIMQKPPLFSALRIQGKRLYEYAREGITVPTEIQERPVEIKEIEIVKWLNGGNHAYKWPPEEVVKENDITENCIHLQEDSINPVSVSDSTYNGQSRPLTGSKRKWINDEDDDLVKAKMPFSKRQEEDPRFSMSGALQNDYDLLFGVNNEDSNGSHHGLELFAKPESSPREAKLPIMVSETVATSYSPNSNILLPVNKGPPAVVLRMIVTSGFYVRSLSHDLGKAVGSLGMMIDLVRTRQGDFELGRNVLEFDDLAKGEDFWAPKVNSMLAAWKETHVDDGEGC